MNIAEISIAYGKWIEDTCNLETNRLILNDRLGEGEKI